MTSPAKAKALELMSEAKNDWLRCALFEGNGIRVVAIVTRDNRVIWKYNGMSVNRATAEKQLEEAMK